ncbi:ABC transporter permease [Lysinibacillus yapensis]|uniref:ABC transporter permease n=1 Tax=Ureibacillus yapensis TaxID=2304605 RepID=A0A396SQS4_9BACL|nr:ABC transporter permease [Lysinibacillus yapensis]RHW38519.1 ABC transporter permease [Lysinibacillus yapensis]
MMAILRTKFLLLARQPASFIITTVIICVFAYVLGLGSQTKLPVAVYSDLSQQRTDAILEELQKIPEKEFTLYGESEAITRVEEGKNVLALHLMEGGFELITSPDFMEAPLVRNQVNTAYIKATQKESIINATAIDQQERVEELFSQASNNPIFHLRYSSFANEDQFIWDSKLHSLFGFSLFMVIYTVANCVHYLIMERRNHIWDRLTISSLGKTKIYFSNILYSFLLGYLQILLVLFIFHYLVGVDFHGGFYKALLLVVPYLLCIVSLAIFIASVVTTPGRFNAIITVIAVPFAMLGGAYWPLEIVTSEAILALSYISPITYGLELLNGATIYQNTFQDLILPLAVLLFMAVVLMGIGINVMEKREQKI